jgi:hypothetical protein
VVVDSPLIMLVTSQGNPIHKLTLSPRLLLKAVRVFMYRYFTDNNENYFCTTSELVRKQETAQPEVMLIS